MHGRRTPTLFDPQATNTDPRFLTDIAVGRLHPDDADHVVEIGKIIGGGARALWSSEEHAPRGFVSEGKGDGDQVATMHADRERGTRPLLPVPLGLVSLGLYSPPIHAETWFGDPIVSSGPSGLFYPQLADLNRDNVPDFVAARANKWYVYLGDPTGRMTPVDTVYTPNGNAAGDFALMDENGDGSTDLIAVYLIGGRAVWRNDGPGHFLFAHNFGPGIERPWTVDDLDGDGYLDQGGTSGSVIGVVYGSPSGLDWAHPQAVGMMSEKFAELMIDAIGFVDLDGDMRKDCVAVGVADDWVDFRAAAVHWRLGLGGRAFSGEDPLRRSSRNEPRIRVAGLGRPGW